MLYIGAVYAGSYALRVGIGYGPTKVAYVIGSATLVLLLSVIARVELPTRVTISVLAVLGLGAVVYGGVGDLASRSWPGDPPPPPWLTPLERTVDRVGATSTAPIACVGTGKWSAYLCTRWGAALTAGGDGPYLGYRLAIANDVDPTELVNAAVTDGTVAWSDIVVIDLPAASRTAEWALISGAARVFGPDGVIMDPRPEAPAS